MRNFENFQEIKVCLHSVCEYNNKISPFQFRCRIPKTFSDTLLSKSLVSHLQEETYTISYYNKVVQICPNI